MCGGDVNGVRIGSKHGDDAALHARLGGRFRIWHDVPPTRLNLLFPPPNFYSLIFLPRPNHDYQCIDRLRSTPASCGSMDY
jgi:hypothetical protein